MALTLTEGAKLSNDVLQQGVIETVIKDSPILQRLPFIEIVGNGLTTYNRENAAASAAFYAVGDAWAESTPTFTQVTASLTILGGDADIDNYIARTRNNVQDIEAAVVELKAKAVQQQFDKTFITGDTTADSKAFNGIDELCAADQTVSMGAKRREAHPRQARRGRGPRARREAGDAAHVAALAAHAQQPRPRGRLGVWWSTTATSSGAWSPTTTASRSG